MELVKLPSGCLHRLAKVSRDISRSNDCCGFDIARVDLIVKVAVVKLIALRYVRVAVVIKKLVKENSKHHKYDYKQPAIERRNAFLW